MLYVLFENVYINEIHLQKIELEQKTRSTICMFSLFHKKCPFGYDMGIKEMQNDVVQNRE